MRTAVNRGSGAKKMNPVIVITRMRPKLSPVERVKIWGRPGFDVGCETLGACRGTDNLVNPAVTLIVANDDNYALAA